MLYPIRSFNYIYHLIGQFLVGSDIRTCGGGILSLGLVPDVLENHLEGLSFHYKASGCYGAFCIKLVFRQNKETVRGSPAGDRKHSDI
jgi:hypothetical protein